MPKESMCDTCMVPGHCCRKLMLGGGDAYRDVDDPVEVERLMAEGKRDGEGGLYAGAVMPFKVLMRRQDGIWVFWCPKLDQRTGRCMDYENRPFCCSTYQPGTDELCVHYWPDPEKQDEEGEILLPLSGTGLRSEHHG
jgi:Fe-S-cluster containining protein